MVNNYKDEVVLMKWEDSKLNPPDEEEPEQTCCDCGFDAELEIEGDFYCVDCAKDKFLYKPECDYCHNEAVFKVGDDFFCEECFTDVFRV